MTTSPMNPGTPDPTGVTEKPADHTDSERSQQSSHPSEESPRMLGEHSTSGSDHYPVQGTIPPCAESTPVR